MIITRRAEYSILGMLYLACREDPSSVSGSYYDVGEIARHIDVPVKFLRVLFHALARAGLLRSQRGSGGGFALTQPPQKISLLKIVEAAQGPVSAFECATFVGESQCEKTAFCGLHVVIRRIQKLIVEELETHTLSSLSDFAFKKPIDDRVFPEDHITDDNEQKRLEGFRKKMVEVIP